MITAEREAIYAEIDKLPLSEKESLTMRACMRRSEGLWMGLIGGKLACIWGAIPPTLISDRCWLWLFHTDALVSHEFLLVRHSQRVVQALLEDYSVLEGITDPKDKKAVRWLMWLGAEFYSPNSEGFLPFEIRKRDNG